MASREDEIVSLILDEGGDPVVAPENREGVAEQMFLHGLLRERFSRGGAVASVVREPQFQRRGRLHFVKAAAAALILAPILLMFLLNEGMPSAHAVIERAIDALEKSIDRHFEIQVFRVGRDQPLRMNDLYCRSDRWV